MKYEIVYYDEETQPCAEETDKFAIFKVKDDNSEMQCYYQVLNSEPTMFNDNFWFKYSTLGDGKEKELTEEELFAIIL